MIPTSGPSWRYEHDPKIAHCSRCSTDLTGAESMTHACGPDASEPAGGWKAAAQQLAEEYSEALDLVEELATQGMSYRDGEYHDNALSAYEDAADFLARRRPKRWEVTPRGMRDLLAGPRAHEADQPKRRASMVHDAIIAPPDMIA